MQINTWIESSDNVCLYAEYINSIHDKFLGHFLVESKMENFFGIEKMRTGRSIDILIISKISKFPKIWVLEIMRYWTWSANGNWNKCSINKSCDCWSVFVVVCNCLSRLCCDRSYGHRWMSINSLIYCVVNPNYIEADKTVHC